MKKIIFFLILVLVSGALYYFYVWSPKQRPAKFSKQEAADISVQFVENQTKKKHFQRMQKIYEATVKQDPNNEIAKKELAKVLEILKQLQ